MLNSLRYEVTANELKSIIVKSWNWASTEWAWISMHFRDYEIKWVSERDIDLISFISLWMTQDSESRSPILRREWGIPGCKRRAKTSSLRRDFNWPGCVGESKHVWNRFRFPRLNFPRFFFFLFCVYCYYNKDFFPFRGYFARFFFFIIHFDINCFSIVISI